jgi:regulator of protease activity HflC (stomatin/prohibitin superfamily)
MNDTDSRRFWVKVAGWSLFVLVLCLLVWPQYNVWRAELNGKAQLVQASQTRQILIEQARAEREAAVLRAEAIEIIGEKAQKYPEYRYQEFLGAFGEALHAGKISQILYVPTEAGIPVLEANRLHPPVTAK